MSPLLGSCLSILCSLRHHPGALPGFCQHPNVNLNFSVLGRSYWKKKKSFAFQENPGTSPQQIVLWGLIIVCVRKPGSRNHRLSCKGDSFCRSSGALSAPVASGLPFQLRNSSRQVGHRLGMSLWGHAHRLYSSLPPAPQPCRNNKCWLCRMNGDMVEICKHTPRVSISQTSEASECCAPAQVSSAL